MNDIKDKCMFIRGILIWDVVLREELFFREIDLG